MPRIVIALAILAVGVVLTSCGGGGAASVEGPPAPASWDHVDPDVAKNIRELIADAEAEPELAARRVDLAVAYHANGMLDLAETTYGQVVAMVSDSAQNWYRMALVQENLGRPEEALASLAKAETIEPSYPPIHWRRGLWLLDLGRADEAEAALLKARQIAPASPAAAAALARVHLRRGEFAEAADVLERIVRLPEARASLPYLRHLLGTAYMRLNRVADGRAQLARATGEQPAWLDQWLAPLADMQFSFKSRVERIDGLLGRLSVDPGAATVAIGELTELLRDRPGDVNLLNKLGTAYIMSGSPDRAVRPLEQAARLDGDLAATHINLSLAWENQGDLDRAVQHARRATEVNSILGDAWRQLGRVHALRSEHVEADRTLALAKRYGANDPGTTSTRGWVLLRLQRLEEAERVFQSVNSSTPGFAEAWVGRGVSLIELARSSQDAPTRQRRFNEARHALSQATAIDPQAPMLEDARNQLEALQAQGGTP